MQSQSVSNYVENDGLLRNTLRVNALFSLLSGVVFVLAAQSMSRWLGLPYPTAFIVVGIGLLPFAFLVYRTFRQAPVNASLAMVIIVMDVGWVVLSWILLGVAWSQLTTVGRWFVVIQADVIALFALLQWIGLRRL